MPKSGLYLVFLLCLLAAGRGFGADTLLYQHFTINEGLPTNNIYSCLKDNNGYLWFATDNGLVKYNGYSFRIFDANNSRLPDNDLYLLRKDDMGRLWVYSLSKSFGYIQNDQYYGLSFPGKTINRQMRGENLTTIAGTTVFSLSVGGNFCLVFYRDNQHCVALPIKMSSFFNRNTGDCYFRLGYYLYVCNVFHPLIPLRQASMLSNNNHLFFGDETGNLNDSILCMFRGGRRTITIINPANGMMNTKPLPIAPDESVYTFNAHGSFVNGFITDKFIYQFNDRLEITSKEPVLSFTKQVPTAYFMQDTADKSSWYCTNGDGIWQKNSFTVPYEKMIGKDSLVNTRLVSNYGSSSFWWNNRTYTLYQMDGRQRLKSWHINGYGRLNSITGLDDQHVIICAQDKSLKLNLLTGELTPFLTWNRLSRKEAPIAPSQYPKDTAVESIVYNAHIIRGKLLMKYISPGKTIASNTNDIHYYQQYGDSLIETSFKADNRYDVMDPQPILGKYIFCSYRSFAVFDTTTATLKIIEVPGENSLSKKVITILHDRWNNIYLLTNEHIILFNPLQLKWKLLDKNFNIADARIALAGDKLFLAGRFGIAAAQIRGAGEVSPFSVSVNFKDRYYRQVNGIWNNSDSAIVLQTDKALYTINVDTFQRNAVLFDSSNIGKFHFALNVPYNKAVGKGDTITITQHDDRLILDAINFYGNGGLHFSFAVSAPGDFAGWQTSASGEIPLTGLQPDICYHIRVKAADAVWKSGVTDLYLYITPYWWQTHNARVLFLIAGSVILILAVIGIVSLTRQAVIRAQAKRRALTELELRAVHSQINPHFIFNTLSTALYFIDRKDYDSAYRHVNKFSHLLRSYLKSSHDRYVLLSEEIDMLKRYIELQQSRFENLFAYEVKVENRVPAEHIQIPSLLLQPLVENAINHGLFHRLEPGGLLQISFMQGNSSDELICVIEDNGIGRMRAMDLKRQNDAERQSYGSKLTDKLVDIFRQYEAMNIHIQYIDKIAPETGTIVKLTIGNVKYVV